MCLLELEIGKRVKVPVLIETAQTADAKMAVSIRSLLQEILMDRKLR